jgi:hypothetical protein
MTNNLNEDYLELIWEGTIEPTLREYFFAEPERLAKFQLEHFTLDAIANDDSENTSFSEAEES